MSELGIIQTAEYWNNKWVKSPTIYAGRVLRTSKERIKTDVRMFIQKDDYLLQELIHTYKLKKDTYNETALACQLFVRDFVFYVSDDSQNGCPEFWQFPFETIVTRRGDCEDGAILMASLMLNAGIPSWRVKVTAGLVQPEPTAPQGGHAYCIYLADRPNGEVAWEIHDWCYYEDTATPTGSKPLAKDGGQNNSYKDVFFTFNNEYSWSPTLTVIESNRVVNSI